MPTGPTAIPSISSRPNASWRWSSRRARIPIVVTRLGGREVIARMRSDARILPGERVPFAFNMDKAVFFDPVSEARVA